MPIYQGVLVCVDVVRVRTVLYVRVLVYLLNSMPLYTARKLAYLPGIVYSSNLENTKHKHVWMSHRL